MKSHLPSIQIPATIPISFREKAKLNDYKTLRIASASLSLISDSSLTTLLIYFASSSLMLLFHNAPSGLLTCYSPCIQCSSLSLHLPSGQVAGWLLLALSCPNITLSETLKPNAETITPDARILLPYYTTTFFLRQMNCIVSL